VDQKGGMEGGKIRNKCFPPSLNILTGLQHPQPVSVLPFLRAEGLNAYCLHGTGEESEEDMVSVHQELPVLHLYSTRLPEIWAIHGKKTSQNILTYNLF
jgi:hypothetical protein